MKSSLGVFSIGYAYCWFVKFVSFDNWLCVLGSSDALIMIT